MDRSGNWALSPAFDMTYSFNPEGAWTHSHQMSMNGKRDGFELEDFKACAASISMKRGRAGDILLQVQETVSRWREFAEEAGVSEKVAGDIEKTQRTNILH